MPPIYHTSNPDEKAVMTENVHLFMAIMIWMSFTPLTAYSVPAIKPTGLAPLTLPDFKEKTFDITVG